MKTQSKGIYQTLISAGLILILASSCTKEVPPALSTLPVGEITENSAQSGGKITDEGGASVTSMGVVWSSSESPTIENNDGYTQDGAGTDEFKSRLTGLTANTTYYVLAYATNSSGTGYGQQVYFTTTDIGGDDNYTEVVDVTNPATGKTWMDRNLGASRVATANDDSEAYGDLYQWGRAADRHEKRNSSTTSTLSSSDLTGHSSFILVQKSPYDWRNPENTDLWQGVSGINNPCPNGYRLPTEAEWDAELKSWSSNNSDGAFASPLKLPVAGYRTFNYGSVYTVGIDGFYWSSTPDGTSSRRMSFRSSNAYMGSGSRARGGSVRCIKD